MIRLARAEAWVTFAYLAIMTAVPMLDLLHRWRLRHTETAQDQGFICVRTDRRFGWVEMQSRGHFVQCFYFNIPWLRTWGIVWNNYQPEQGLRRHTLVWINTLNDLHRTHWSIWPPLEDPER